MTNKGGKVHHLEKYSKWCAYHEDFGHIIEDYIALRKEISYLLSNGYLKEILGRRKERSTEKDQYPRNTLEKPGSLLQTLR